MSDEEEEGGQQMTMEARVQRLEEMVRMNRTWIRQIDDFTDAVWGQKPISELVPDEHQRRTPFDRIERLEREVKSLHPGRTTWGGTKKKRFRKKIRKRTRKKNKKHR